MTVRKKNHGWDIETVFRAIRARNHLFVDAEEITERRAVFPYNVEEKNDVYVILVDKLNEYISTKKILLLYAIVISQNIM